MRQVMHSVGAGARTTNARTCTAGNPILPTWLEGSNPNTPRALLRGVTDVSINTQPKHHRGVIVAHIALIRTSNKISQTHSGKCNFLANLADVWVP